MKIWVLAYLWQVFVVRFCCPESFFYLGTENQSGHISSGKISHLQDFHNLMTSERPTDQKMPFSRKRVLATALNWNETAEFIKDTKNSSLAIKKIKKIFFNRKACDTKASSRPRLFIAKNSYSSWPLLLSNNNNNPKRAKCLCFGLNISLSLQRHGFRHRSKFNILSCNDNPAVIITKPCLKRHNLLIPDTINVSYRLLMRHWIWGWECFVFFPHFVIFLYVKKDLKV